MQYWGVLALLNLSWKIIKAACPKLIPVALVVVLAACKEDDEKGDADTNIHNIKIECSEGANRMFPDAQVAETEKYERCMSKKLGKNWRLKHPELSPD
ncbi:MAG: hypothetical protein KUG58_05260 [Marinosulfonomonas sp.]|nr:hypothetical protein [Marinosulfonomonas sp.]